MTFRPWEQYHESSAAAVRLYITVADFNWRDTDYDGPYNGSKGYVPVQAELVGRRAPARCASKHTALLGVCGEWGLAWKDAGPVRWGARRTVTGDLSKVVCA